MPKAEKLKLVQDLHKLLNKANSTVVLRAYQEGGQEALAGFKSRPYPSGKLSVKEIAGLLVPVLDALNKLAVKDNDDKDDDDEDDDAILAPPEEEAEVVARALARPCTQRHRPTRSLTPALAVARSAGFPC